METFNKPKLATVVLADDSLADIDYIKSILKKHQVICNLYICRNGQEILDFIYKKGRHRTDPLPDLILLDLKLPKIDGFGILKILQNDPALKSLPVMIVSGSLFDEDITRSYKQGAKFYMRKPFKICSFLTSIQELKSLTIEKTGGSINIYRV